jgi:hypothetical protein
MERNTVLEKRMNLNTMTLGELHEHLGFMLKTHGYDTKVVVAAASGDYWGRLIALRVNEITSEKVVYSPYHSRFRITDVHDSEDGENVIVLGE